MDTEVIDLFAGPGGLDVAARSLGLDPLGIEYDDAACATRAAAGLRTLQADVASLDPTDFAPCDGVVGSPPCPTFSRGGNRAGQQLAEIIFAALLDIAEGKDTRAQHIEEAFRVLEPTAAFAELPEPRRSRKRLQRRSSPVQAARLAARQKIRERSHHEAVMSLLVVEPLRWALALEPTFLAWEQVPDVMPFWERCAEFLRAAGWNVWTGVLVYGEWRQARDSGPGAEREPRDPSDPSYTIRANGSGSHPSGVRWVHERPATTVQGDPRLFPAGRAERDPSYEPGGEAVSQAGAGSTAVKVTLEEAAMLQTFPPDYPFQGSKSKRFQQVGNAVPPLLARAILESLLS